VRYIQ